MSVKSRNLSAYYALSFEMQPYSLIRKNCQFHEFFICIQFKLFKEKKLGKFWREIQIQRSDMSKLFSDQTLISSMTMPPLHEI